MRIPEPIPDSWFDHPGRLHGAKHTSRVIYHVRTLSTLLSNFIVSGKSPAWFPECTTTLVQKAEQLALLAAVIHDLARTHDGRCHIHGERAAHTKRHYAEMVHEAPINEDDWKIISSAVTRHSIPDKPLRPCFDDLVLALLKDADALDRVRLHGEGPDPAFFRLPFSAGQIELARRLYQES